MPSRTKGKQTRNPTRFGCLVGIASKGGGGVSLKLLISYQMSRCPRRLRAIYYFGKSGDTFASSGPQSLGGVREI